MLAACHRKPAPAPAPSTTTVNRDSINAARAREDSIRAARARDQAMRDSLARANAVFFDYDQSDIRDDARAALEAKLPILGANPSVKLRIAGHTDSRGSDEYNLALGARRAGAAKAFLAERGIDAARVEIVSFGEERPTCTEEEESCWSRNRRAEFEITAGGQPLALPNNGR